MSLEPPIDLVIPNWAGGPVRNLLLWQKAIAVGMIVLDGRLEFADGVRYY
jgi:hypothetical protein